MSTSASRQTPDIARAKDAIRELLLAFGIDADSEAFRATPATAVRALSDVLLAGYGQSPETALGRGFPVQGRGPVIAARLPIMFMCPHHLLPAQGEIHIAFLPKDRVPGLSRIARLVDSLAHRLVLQEDLTSAIALSLLTQIDAEAVVVIIEARHSCVAVEDFARRTTLFRTRATIGPRRLTASLESEIDATLNSPWATPASKPRSAPQASRSPSPEPPTSRAPRKKRTRSRRRRSSRSGGS